MYQDAYESSPDIVKIKIQGPNYYDTLSVTTDRDLNFSTTISIKQVLGFNAGNYNVDISYGDYSVEMLKEDIKTGKFILTGYRNIPDNKFVNLAFTELGIAASDLVRQNKQQNN